MRPAAVAAIWFLASCGFSDSVGSTAQTPEDAREIDSVVTGSEPTVPVCSTVGLTCAQGDVVIDCTGGCWVGCRESTQHAIAKQRCTDWGGELARIEMLEQQTCVNAAFAGSGRWLGVEQDTSSTTVLDGWSWAGDGLSMTYVNWAPGQPNDDDGQENGQEQCAYLANPSGLWHDTPCTTPSGAFICRR